MTLYETVEELVKRVGALETQLKELRERFNPTEEKWNEAWKKAFQGKKDD